MVIDRNDDHTVEVLILFKKRKWIQEFTRTKHISENVAFQMENAISLYLLFDEAKFLSF